MKLCKTKEQISRSAEEINLEETSMAEPRGRGSKILAEANK